MTSPNKRPKCNSPIPPQHGFASFAVLAVFAVLTMLGAVWMRAAAQDARRQRRLEERAHAQWLVEAGLRRAAAQLAANGDYTGEEWAIAAEELGRPDPAAVEIKIERADDAASVVQLVVQARYPNDNPRVRASKRVAFRLAPQEPQQ